MDIFNQFGVNPILLAAQVVNFLILLFILKKFLYKPILKVMDERREKIEEGLKNAEEIEQRLVKITQQEEESLLKSAKESEKIIKQATEQASQIIAEGKITSEGILTKASEEAVRLLQTERGKLEQDIRENLSDIIILAFEKVTGKAITKKEQKAFIEKGIKDLV